MLQQLLDALQDAGVQVHVVDLDASPECEPGKTTMKLLRASKETKATVAQVEALYRENGQPEVADRIKERFEAKRVAANAMCSEIVTIPYDDTAAYHDALNRLNEALRSEITEASAWIREVCRRHVRVALSAHIDDLLV